MRDPGLDLDVGDVEHRDRRRLGPCPRRGRDREVRLQRRGRLLALADRRVDVVHHRRRVRGDEVCDLRGVHARAAADRHEPVDLVLDREVGGVLEGVDRGLDAGAVVDDHLDALVLDQALDALGMPERRNARVGDHHHPLDAEALELPSRVGRGATAKLHRRGFHREDRLVVGSHGSLLLLASLCPWVVLSRDGPCASTRGGRRRTARARATRSSNPPTSATTPADTAARARLVVRPGRHRAGRRRDAPRARERAPRSCRREATPGSSARASRATARCSCRCSG